MEELRRPDPEQRMTSRISARAERLRERLRSNTFDAEIHPGEDQQSDQSSLHLVMVAVGAAVLALGSLWAWQTWSGRAAEPIDAALPLLLESTAEATPVPAESSEDETDGRGESVTVLAPEDIAPPGTPEPTPTAAEATAVPQIIVHVSGAVVTPGVVQLPAGSRVFEAVDGAGSATSDADLDRVNLAAPLVDGERVHVPAVGEDAAPELVPSDRPQPDPWAAYGPGPFAPAAAPPAPTATPTPVIVDLNRASVSELQALPGVGPTIAQAIVAARASRGPFLTVDELLDVAGIGPATLEELRPFAWVQDAP